MTKSYLHKLLDRLNRLTTQFIRCIGLVNALQVSA